MADELNSRRVRFTDEEQPQLQSIKRIEKNMKKKAKNKPEEEAKPEGWFKLSSMFERKQGADFMGNLAERKTHPALRVTPAELIEQVNFVAQRKFKTTLPDKFSAYTCLDTKAGKLAFVKDLC